MKHIELDEIHTYMEGQLAEERKRAVESHLAACEKCGNAMKALSAVFGNLQLTFKKPELAGTCPEDWTLAALIRQELPSTEAESIRAHINNCGSCMERAAVYYKADITIPSFHAAAEWKEKAVNAITEDKVVEEVPHKTPSFKVFNLFKNVFRPAVLSGYAIAAAASIVFLILSAMPEKPKVVSIASTERISFKTTNAPFAFGFMGSEEVKKFDGMELSIKDDELVMLWKPVKGAKEYKISVLNRETGKALIKDVRALGPTAVLSLEKIKRNDLYRWVITGSIGDEEQFEYTGEFLIAE